MKILRTRLSIVSVVAVGFFGVFLAASPPHRVHHFFEQPLRGEIAAGEQHDHAKADHPHGGDPSDSAVAAVVDNADRAEGWVFGYVHKFEWLVPFVGIDARDAIAMTLALMIAGAAFLGLALFRQRARQRARGSKTVPETH